MADLGILGEPNPVPSLKSRAVTGVEDAEDWRGDGMAAGLGR
jgi:hypothetical protein